MTNNKYPSRGMVNTSSLANSGPVVRRPSSVVHRPSSADRRPVRLSKILFGLSAFLLVMGPSPAFAHDNLGGDELAAIGWMLVSALVVAAMGALALVWAIRAGQFNNVEESKFSMLDTAENYDAIMAEYEERVIESRNQKSEEKEIRNLKSEIREPKPDVTAQQPELSPRNS